ncbi:MAG: hypothetical protein ACRCWY_04220 [Cellulosilyticaceae bacterium]
MDKEYKGIQYGIMWYVDTTIAEQIDKKTLDKSIGESCKQLGIKLEDIQLREKSIAVVFLADKPLNLTKIQGIFFKQVKMQYPRFQIQQFIGVTKSHVPAKEDNRIRQLLQQVDEIAYYDLDEVCDEEEAFKGYLGERYLTIIEQGSKVFLVDEKALSEAIFLNCFACTKIYKYGCCCGSPCDLSEKNKRNFRKHEKKIEDAMKMVNSTDYDTLKVHGGFLKKDGSINEYEGKCSMLVEEDGVYKCMTHKYALDEGIPIYELCPLSCLMYPLEIIELVANFKTKATLLTSAMEETFAKAFSRWGSYKGMDVDLRCLDKKDHDDAFLVEHYKPVYQVNEGLLTHEFGPALYQVLEQLLQTP